MPERTPARIPERIISLDDPRLLPYRNLKGSGTPRRLGQFIVEGDKLVERLLASSLEIISVLASDRLADRYIERCPADATILIADDALLSEVVGFDFHRGALACGRRPIACCPNDPAHDSAAAIQSLATGNTLVACPLIHDPENLGLIVRTAAGLGADGLLMSNSGADVFARRCLRVSMGAAFLLPIVQVSDMAAALRSLQVDHDIQLIASTLADRSVNATSFELNHRFALLMGSEPDGLPDDIEAMADVCIKMDMHRGIDSHNVAVATGMLLQQLILRRDGR